MARRLKTDRWLFLTTLFLVAFSVLMVYSASAMQAMDKHKTGAFFLYRQGQWALLGFALLFVVMRIDYHDYRKPEVIWSLIGVTGVLLVAVLFSAKINGTHRWLSLRVLSVQPSELAKLATVLFTAAVLEQRMHRINDLRYAVMPIALLTLAFVALIMAEPDFGTSAVLVFVVGTMLFFGGLHVRYVFGSLGMLLPAAIVLILSAGYRIDRIKAYLDPYSDAQGKGYQTIQSLYAIGSGGVLGRGLMNGVQKIYYLPEPHTDFIFSVIAEELGLVGTTVTLICFAILAWRGLRIALLAPDRFGAFLALGITAMVSLQAFVNVCVVTALLPNKGLTLPFVSSGGSSLLINMVAMGVLLNISQQTTAIPAPGKRTQWTLHGQEA